MTDTRPLLSAMPAHLEQILDRRGAELTQLLIATYRDVMASAPERPQAELQNDAFSMMAQFLAMGGATLTAQLSDAKAVPLRIVHPVALGDVAARWAMLIDCLEAQQALNAGATRQ